MIVPIAPPASEPLLITVDLSVSAATGAAASAAAAFFSALGTFARCQNRRQNERVCGPSGDNRRWWSSVECVLKSHIKALIDEEDAKNILSDDQLVDMLKERGFDIARRTVAKYRESLRIPSSMERRREKVAMAMGSR